MLRNRESIAIGLIALAGALAGCDAYPLQNLGASAEEAFMAVDVSGVGGTDGLSAKADATAFESATISLPEDILADLPNEAILAVSAAEIAVVVNGDANGRAKSTAKTQEHHATITFRLAHKNQEACDALDQVGPFELTITDGVVTLAEDSLPLGAGARSVVRNGWFGVCAETWADFDGSISVGQMSFEFGRLRGNEERVVLCHVPPGNPDNAHTITVGSSVVDAHLAHGDYLGECEEQDENPLDDDWDDDGNEDADGDAAGDDDNDDGSGDEDDGDDDATGGDDDAGDDDADDETDDDGVTDDSDACPETPVGEEVDASGCSCDQRDGDADGVNDCDDACPNSDSGAEVDDRGCADADLADDDDDDGVNNENDVCPNTLAGETADATGCSCSQKDADGDGVDDCDDTCADTDSSLSVDTNGCAANQVDDDSDGVTNDVDTCPDTPTSATSDASGCAYSQLDADSDGVTDCNDLCPNTPDGETADGDGCSASQLTRTVTVYGPTDIYLAGQPDGATANWPYQEGDWTSEAPEHSPAMIDISVWAGKELAFTASGSVNLGGSNGAYPDGRDWVLRPAGLSQVYGLTAMRDFRHGALVGVFLTDDLPTSGLLPYMSSSGITTTTPPLQHIFVIGSSSQVVIPGGATRLFFGVAEQQGCIIDNSGSFEVTVEAVAHTPLPADPLAATRFYTGDPNDPKDGIGWFDAGEWAFDFDFDGVADFTTTFGQAGDQPIVGDWNGDGLDEIGVMTPLDSGNVWKLDANGNGVFDGGDETFTYGADAGSIALAGDWDGNGTFEFGFTTPDTLWHLDLDGDRTDDTDEALDTHYESSIPVVGDWTGDGISNLANSSIGSYGWRFDLDNDRRWIWGTDYRDEYWVWGTGDVGVAGDWDGDGLDDPARHRSSTGDWSFTDRVQKGGSIASAVTAFGADKTPVVGSWATIRAADAD